MLGFFGATMFGGRLCGFYNDMLICALLAACFPAVCDAM